MSASPRAGLRDLDPYQSPQPPTDVRLNTNESPYPPSAALRRELAEAVRRESLNRYPDGEAEALRRELARHTGHPFEGVWAANGSNEVIEQLLLAHGGPGRTVVVFEPTYLLHRRLAWIAHSPVESIRVPEPWTIRPEDVDLAIAADPRVVLVCSPNNPTGNTQPVAAVERLASATNALVVVDEAYVEFGGKSALHLLGAHPNVVVVRTFSKAFGLAGARIGYCLAAPEVVDDLRRVRLPYHLSALTQAAGLVALRHAGEASAILAEIRAQRNRILAETPAMGVETFPSEANFVLFRPPKPAMEVWGGLLERGVLVRDVSDSVPGCLRVTAGTRGEVDRFLEALAEVMR
jgi:histidinol-phosphate aminotransferase